MFNRAQYYKRTKASKVKTTKHEPRGREDGFVSRSGLARLMGMTDFNAWSIVEDAMKIAGMGKRERGPKGGWVFVPDPVALAGRFAQEGELNEDGSTKLWYVFDPKLVDELREPLVKAIEARKARTERPVVQHTYPEGFVSAATLKRKLACGAAVIPRLLRVWGYAEPGDGALVASKSAVDDGEAHLHVDDEKSQWYVWRESFFLSEFAAHFITKPEDRQS